jgi:hypothetical protein
MKFKYLLVGLFFAVFAALMAWGRLALPNNSGTSIVSTTTFIPQVENEYVVVNKTFAFSKPDFTQIPVDTFQLYDTVKVKLLEDRLVGLVDLSNGNYVYAQRDPFVKNISVLGTPRSRLWFQNHFNLASWFFYLLIVLGSILLISMYLAWHKIDSWLAKLSTHKADFKFSWIEKLPGSGLGNPAPFYAAIISGIAFAVFYFISPSALQELNSHPFAFILYSSRWEAWLGFYTLFPFAILLLFYVVGCIFRSPSPSGFFRAFVGSALLIFSFAAAMLVFLPALVIGLIYWIFRKKKEKV